MPVPIKTYQYDLDGNFINEYPSQIVASEQICVSQNSIRRHIWRQRQTCGGFIFTQTLHIKLPKT